MVRYSNTWVFNIAPENWTACASGPTDAAVHGEDHVGNPWHGLRTDPADGPDLEPGDLVLARVTSADGTNPEYGVKGVWEFVEAAPVDSQADIPWTDSEYSWVFYCRPIHREFATPFTEDFGTEPSFSSNTLQGSVKSLQDADKHDYLTTLLEHAALNSSSQDRFLEELPEPSDQETISEATNVWIEKTYLDGRDYKQSGDYALGKAIYSPSQNRAGHDAFKTMRQASVGDVVLHLLQEEGEIVGASRIESRLDTDFGGFPALDWTPEQRREGGYLRWLTQYQEFETPLEIYADVLENGTYSSYLDGLREEYTHLPYDRNLELAQGTYLARCPPELAIILAFESNAIKSYLQDTGIATDPLPEPLTGDDDPREFESISTATRTVLDCVQGTEYEPLLADHVETATVQAWTEALRGFEPNASLTPTEESHLNNLVDTLAELRPTLSQIAAEFNIGPLDSAEPHEVVFLALLRDLQDTPAVDGAVNANHVKLTTFKNDAYFAFDNVKHPLVQAVRTADTTVYSLTAPPSYWLTALRYRAYGFKQANHDIWQKITPGDVLLFHAGGRSNHPELDERRGFIFGGAVAGHRTTSEAAWWYDEVAEDATFPYLVAFDSLFLTAGAQSLGDPPAVRETTDLDELQSAIDRLEQGALDMSDVNELCQAVVGTEFPARAGVVRLEDAETDFGRREALVDRLAGITDAATPIAIHRDFDGTIPAEAFEDLHFPSDAGIASASELADQITAALRAGDHIIFTGPPGTGKTEIAEAVATHLQAEYPYLYSGSQLTTATADWSTFDTVGGYMPDPNAVGEHLDFHPGVILNRFKDTAAGLPVNEPVIIDEINRANIDKAFGQLFTTLSGQRVTLPFRLNGAPDREVEVVPAAQLDDATGARGSPAEFVVPTSWRILATMNTFDKTSLYELSYAFMRRFTFIRVGVPDIPTGPGTQERFLRTYARAWGMNVEGEVLTQVASVWQATNTAVPERSIGPAIVKDILAYVTAHDHSMDVGPRLTEAVVSYIFPQLEGVPEREEIVRALSQVGVVDTTQLERAAADMLGIHDGEWSSED